MKQPMSNKIPLESRKGFLNGLGGLLKNKTNKTNNLGIMQFAQGGAVYDKVVDDFISQPSNITVKESREFVRGNPRLTSLLRTLILAPQLVDILKPEQRAAMADAYDNDLFGGDVNSCWCYFC